MSAETAKLMGSNSKSENQLPKVFQGVKFRNGLEVIVMPAHHAG
jgi:hypothetical protein